MTSNQHRLIVWISGATCAVQLFLAIIEKETWSALSALVFLIAFWFVFYHNIAVLIRRREFIAKVDYFASVYHLMPDGDDADLVLQAIETGEEQIMLWEGL
jgi:hypothetical protein